MIRKIRSILFFTGATLVAAHCLIGGAAFAQLQDDGQPCPPECVIDSMEIVTWYPSPYNEYEELRLYPISDPNSQCIDANRGLMYYDSEEDKVKLCKGPAGLNNWQDLGYWESSTINTDDIYYNTGNVGIGITNPSAGGEQDLKLDVEGAIGARYYCNENGNNCRSAPLGGGPDYDSGWTPVSLSTNYTFTHNFGQKAKDVRIWVAQNSDGSGWNFIANGLIIEYAGPYTVYGVGINQNNLNDINIRVAEQLGYIQPGGWCSSGYIKVLAWK